VAWLTAEGRSPAEILAEDPACAEPLEFPAHYTYRRQVVALDMPGSWRRVRAPVLVVYGTSDYLTNAAEHHFIGGIVNRERPGQATVRILEGMDHGFLIARDYEESLRIYRGEAPASLDPRIVDELDSWMAAFEPSVPGHSHPTAGQGQ
jgi:pimeloyl-ACP methyl ester carboxylesterase